MSHLSPCRKNIDFWLVRKTLYNGCMWEFLWSLFGHKIRTDLKTNRRQAARIEYSSVRVLNQSEFDILPSGCYIIPEPNSDQDEDVYAVFPRGRDRCHLRQGNDGWRWFAQLHAGGTQGEDSVNTKRRRQRRLNTTLQIILNLPPNCGIVWSFNADTTRNTPELYILRYWIIRKLTFVIVYVLGLGEQETMEICVWFVVIGWTHFWSARCVNCNSPT